jgi:hypothetical protein
MSCRIGGDDEGLRPGRSLSRWGNGRGNLRRGVRPALGLISHGGVTRTEGWGGRPRPRPAPWPAYRLSQVVDSAREERVRGDPRGPGGPPHQFGCILPPGLI